MTRRPLQRVLLVIAGSILLAAFALYPALTMPLGDRLEMAARRTIEHGGCRGIHLVVTTEQMADLGRVTIEVDGRPLAWTWTDRQRDFSRYLLEIRFTETIPRGVEIEVTAPFPPYYRPLYWPAPAERAAILIGRLSLWLPHGGIGLAGLLMAFPLIASGLLLKFSIHDCAAEAISSNGKTRES